jgi:iron complex outermembrane receptor protein
LVRANHYGSVRYKPDLPVNDEVFGAKTLFDLEAGYQLTKNLRVSVGADNVFNVFPDQTRRTRISAWAVSSTTGTSASARGTGASITPSCRWSSSDG